MAGCCCPKSANGKSKKQMANRTPHLAVTAMEATAPMEMEMASRLVAPLDLPNRVAMEMVAQMATEMILFWLTSILSVGRLWQWGCWCSALLRSRSLNRVATAMVEAQMATEMEMASRLVAPPAPLNRVLTAMEAQMANGNGFSRARPDPRNRRLCNGELNETIRLCWWWLAAIFQSRSHFHFRCH